MSVMSAETVRDRILRLTSSRDASAADASSTPPQQEPQAKREETINRVRELTRKFASLNDSAAKRLSAVKKRSSEGSAPAARQDAPKADTSVTSSKAHNPPSRIPVKARM